MKRILNANVHPAPYYMVLDYITHKDGIYNRMMEKYGTHKLTHLDIYQYNELLDEALEYFKSQTIKDSK